jgi:GxxExxY protein
VSIRVIRAKNSLSSLIFFKMKHQELTGQIIQCAYKVHKTLGFGFLENVYQNALLIELTQSGLKAVKETPIRVSYEGQNVGEYAADILVEDRIILELKSVKELHPAHEAQLVNYLKATGLEVGLLINFGEIKRKVLTPRPSPADSRSQEIEYPIS